ncbi:hypothetical protein [Leifsonia sp. NPDC058248]|uniref:hypothetical protein n=1 Tax=Leifsonia sp. NPDC058248 TaxID=3346402 RepID=UPI0036DBE408
MTQHATDQHASSQHAATPAVPASRTQAKYQLRFDWGADGAAAIAPDADVVVWVDVLAPAPGSDDAVAVTDPLALPGIPAAAAVVAGGLTTASAVAGWVLDEQVALGRRALISIVAAGGSSASGALRFAVEDQLAAGAIIDALAAVGIDYSSPEAAAACAAFTGLRGAVAHLLTASVSGQEHIAAGLTPAEVAPFGRLDSESAVTILRGVTRAE